MASVIIPNPFEPVRPKKRASLKILLVLPIREGAFQVNPDVGLLYLGTVLKTKGHRVTVVDCPKERMSYDEFKTLVQEGEFDVVGFRCFSRDHRYVNHHANIVKSINPRTLTLVGGPHPSALPEYVLGSMPNVDFAWKAEAEEGLPTLVELFAEHQLDIPEHSLSTVPGLVWRSAQEQRIVVNSPGFGIDLDSYTPDWSLLDPESYPDFERRKSRRTRVWDGFFHVTTTRGCPYPCTYCNAPNLSGKKLRHRSVDRVIEELMVLKQRYGAKRFSIIDDEFTLSKKYATSFCQGLIDAKVNMNWDCPNGVRMDTLYPELLQLMEAAGCDALCVGIESGNDRVQKLIQKKTSVDVIRERAGLIARCTKIKVTGYFMIGFLDETEREIQDTIDFACSLPLVRAAFNIVIPIPGTRIFDELIEKDKLRLSEINWDTLTNDQVAFKRDHVSGSRLIELRRQAFFRFYSRPDRVWAAMKESWHNRAVATAAIQKIAALTSKKETNSFVPMYQRQQIV